MLTSLNEHFPNSPHKCKFMFFLMQKESWRGGAKVVCSKIHAKRKVFFFVSIWILTKENGTIPERLIMGGSSNGNLLKCYTAVL
jgi:hypothetical protein